MSAPATLCECTGEGHHPRPESSKSHPTVSQSNLLNNPYNYTSLSPTVPFLPLNQITHFACFAEIHYHSANLQPFPTSTPMSTQETFSKLPQITIPNTKPQTQTSTSQPIPPSKTEDKTPRQDQQLTGSRSPHSNAPDRPMEPPPITAQAKGEIPAVAVVLQWAPHCKL